VGRLLDGYPHLNLPKPEEYMSALVEVLQSYPLWTGEMAIKRTDDNPQFLPSDRQMRKWCSDLIAPALSLQRPNSPNEVPKVTTSGPYKPPASEPSLEERARMALLLEQSPQARKRAKESTNG